MRSRNPKAMSSMTGCRQSSKNPVLTGMQRGFVSHIMLVEKAGPLFLPEDTSVCTWLATFHAVPDHSTLSRTRNRLPLEVHEKIFRWVLAKVAECGLVVGGRIGVDSSTMEANAAMRTIVRRDTGESYRQMLTRMAKESGIKTPTSDELIRLDKKRKDKKLRNSEWVSPVDPEAKIAKMKDGTTQLGYKPEHAVDLDTGAIVAVEVYPGDRSDTSTLKETLSQAGRNLKAATPTPPRVDDPAEVSADKGYHSREVLKELEGGPWKTRIAEPKAKGFLLWRGDHEARAAVYKNRARIKSQVGRFVSRLRTEVVERSFAHLLVRGGMRRVWLRGVENIKKRYLIHVAGFNLSLLMRQMIGYGTPRRAADAPGVVFLFIQTHFGSLLMVILVSPDRGDGILAIAVFKNR